MQSLLEAAVAKEGIPVHIEAAAEYYCDHEFEKSIKNKAWYQANKERVNKYQMERYYRLKEQKNECQ